jgi:hypothetical protein
MRPPDAPQRDKDVLLEGDIEGGRSKHGDEANDLERSRNPCVNPTDVMFLADHTRSFSGTGLSAV